MLKLSDRLAPTSWFLIELRSLIRRVGLVWALKTLRTALRTGQRVAYEPFFDSALSAAIRPGDVVWDVGANVGTYTRKFSNWAGDTGLVYAFEPVPECFSKLQDVSAQRKNIRAFNIALADIEGSLPMKTAADRLGTTHALATGAARDSTVILVDVFTGDEVRRRERLKVPNVVKIDVEGFEEEVLLGMRDTLANEECRAVFCEVHYALLDKRGERHAPRRIEKYLRGKGFSIRWVDSSHLAALR